MNTRKDDILDRLGDVVFRKEARLNLQVLQQLPSYHYVYNRILTLLSEKPLRLPGKVPIVINELAGELRDIWIYMNIPPRTLLGVAKKLETLFKIFDKHRRVTESKRGTKWNTDNEQIISKLQHGFDIKATK